MLRRPFIIFNEIIHESVQGLLQLLRLHFIESLISELPDLLVVLVLGLLMTLPGSPAVFKGLGVFRVHVFRQ